MGRFDDFLIYGKPEPDWEEAIAPTGERFIVRSRPRGVIRLSGPYVGFGGVVLAVISVPLSWLLHATVYRMRWAVVATRVSSEKLFRGLANEPYDAGGGYRVCETSRALASQRLSEVVADIEAGRRLPGRQAPR